MNKKGAGFSVGTVLALGLLIVFLIALTGGGAGKIWEIARFLTKIPAPVWVVGIIVYIFMKK